MHNVNDTIVYGADGVCVIRSIVKKDFNGKEMKYYVLQPVYSENSTIYVPVDNPVLTEKMRRVLSAQEIFDLIHSMPEQEPVWIENENLRKEKFKEILASGDRMELIRVIKALYIHQQKQQEKGKKLHISDERFFKDAEKMLYDEFALVLHIRRDEVLPFILEQIELEEKLI